MDTARSTARLKPVLLEDRITSDGQTVLGVDNRAGITCLLSAVELIVQEHKKCPGFTLVFTICEESTLAGSRHLNIPPGIDMAYTFDSSHRPGLFISKAPGAKNFDIQVNGKAAHSGIAPEDGINALQIAAKAIAGLPLGRIDDDSTMNIGPFMSKAATNVVPFTVKLTGEIRSSTATRIQALEALINEHFEATLAGTGATFTYTSRWDFHPYSFESSATIWKRLEKSILSAELKPNGLPSFGGSDANVLNGKGTPTINLGIGAQNPHSNEEFILYEDLISTTKIALELMKNDI